jgi:YD repeat-containing protein
VQERVISLKTLWIIFVLLILQLAAEAACPDCALAPLGGPAENRYTHFDAISTGEASRDPGFPRVYVNAANLTLFVQVTDLAFGGPSPTLTIEHAFNMDDTAAGLLGPGWSFSLGDSLVAQSDGSLVLHRGSGRTDRFAAAAGAAVLFPITATTDTLVRTSTGYTLRSASGPARTFSSEGRLLAILDGALVRVSLDYDSSGRLSEAHYRGTTIAFATDSGGRLTSMKDAAGRTVAFSYDDSGRLSAHTNADGVATAYEYDSEGRLAAVIWNGGKTAIAYAGDAGAYSVASVTTPDAAVRQYDTPNSPQEIRIVDGNGNASWYTSTEQGLLVSAKDAAGNTTSFSYDANGNRTRSVNAAGEAWTLTYDSASHLTSVTDPSGARWSATYTAGAIASVTDPNKKAWAYAYDSTGLLASTTDPLGFAIATTRNAYGQILSLSDQKGNPRTWKYNADGLLTGYTDALGNAWSYAYDGAARAASVTDPAGTAVRASYNAANRVSSLSNGDTSAAFDYSGIQRDAMNRLAGYTDSYGNQIGYAYHANGQLASITYPGDRTVTYTYDVLNRLSQVADWQGNLALYRYDVAGWPLSVSVLGGPVTIYQYDAARNLRAIVSTGPDGSPVAGYRYTYDAAGNRTGSSSLEPNTAALPLRSYAYTFDAANNALSRDDGATLHYDARGLLTSIEGPVNTQFAYDPFGRLSSLAGDTSGSYSYDSTGLRTGRNDRRLVFDLSGTRPRLVMETDSANAPLSWYVYGLGLLWKVTADGTTYFYHFDGDGNTVAISNPTAGVVNTYRYDAAGLLVNAQETVDNPFRARGEAGLIDDGNGLLFDGTRSQLAGFPVSLPGTPALDPPIPNLTPPLAGVAACFMESAVSCPATAARRIR